MPGPDPASLNDLRPDPRNARKHGARNVGMIQNALQDVGAGRSIVIDEEGTVLAGNATMQAALQAGRTKIRVVDTDGEEIIAVRRTNLTDDQKTRLALYDNRAAELAEWDGTVLAGVAEQDPRLLDGIFAAGELANLLPPGPRPRFVGGDPQFYDDDDLDEGDDDDLGGGLDSQVKMVQLFLTVATFPEYAALCERLRTAFQLTTATDAVMEGLRRACAALDQ